MAAAKGMSDPEDAKTDPAVTVCFTVTVDGESLGYFSTCDGLGVELVMEQREEGGTNGFVWQLPSRLKYSNVKLSRAVGKDSNLVTQWLIGFADEVARKTACISAMTADGRIVASWSLDGVMPVKWTGPSLNLDSPKVAMETLELAHHGFLPKGS